MIFITDKTVKQTVKEKQGNNDNKTIAFLVVKRKKSFKSYLLLALVHSSILTSAKLWFNNDKLLSPFCRAWKQSNARSCSEPEKFLLINLLSTSSFVSFLIFVSGMFLICSVKSELEALEIAQPSPECTWTIYYFEFYP